MIKDDILKLIHKYLKEHNKERVGCLRYLLSQIKYKEIDLKKDITDEETYELLRKEVKKRREAIELFQKGNRPDLVLANLSEIKIIEEFLPPALPEEEIIKIIDDILAKSEGESHPGKIIGMVMSLSKGRAEGGIIAKLVQQKLNKS
ncbi:hypothetical protein A2W14_03370 [Candidatus Gottesmanbacteria bacterium RBG_16_37_8]|uniref:Glutamyl-tRNA amidotransferase n=1 Tax=Candidatus Gottesmanbacteria bacterium RBG_16_37_8 TaxID=1798371 RepID=A0A1F5YTQ6_9BACT|nr:MAG: hypothetical protein A2W14_03370 [Candidatus Gottesmanbacteria bacterium RBG_16_37_8]